MDQVARANFVGGSFQDSRDKHDLGIALKGFFRLMNSIDLK